MKTYSGFLLLTSLRPVRNKHVALPCAFAEKSPIPHPVLPARNYVRRLTTRPARLPIQAVL
jgi:hypothetical protein